MSLTLGATLLEGSQCQFLVWAPHAKNVEVRILDPRDSFSAATTVQVSNRGGDRLLPLEKRFRGYHAGLVTEVEPGTRYVYCLDREKDRARPSLFLSTGRCSQTFPSCGPAGISLERFELARTLP